MGEEYLPFSSNRRGVQKANRAIGKGSLSENEEVLLEKKKLGTKEDVHLKGGRVFQADEAARTGGGLWKEGEGRLLK